MKPPLSYIPALPAVIGLVAGILVEYSVGDALWLSLLLLVPIFYFAWNRRWLFAMGLWFVCIGMVVSYYKTPVVPDGEYLGKKVKVSGRIASVDESDAAISCIVDVDKISIADSGSIRNVDLRMNVVVGDLDVRLQCGDVIVATGELNGLDPVIDVPDKTDYKKYLFIDGVGSEMWVYRDEIMVISHEPTFFESFSSASRTVLFNSILDAGFSPGITEFMLALIAGEDSYIDRELAMSFRSSGLAHILALSGLHVSIIIALVMGLLWIFRSLPGGRICYYGIPIVVVWLYAVATGMSPSVCRATVMISVFLMAKMIQAQPNSWNSLCVTVLVWLLINPFWIFSVGFQLSVIAVVSLIWYSGVIGKYGFKPWKSRIISLICVPIVAVMATSVFVLFYFHTLPAWFLPANIVMSIFVVPIMLIGGIVVLSGAVGLQLKWLAEIVDFMYDCLETTVNWFGGLPGAQLGPYFPDTAQYVLWILVIICIGWGVSIASRRRRMYIWGTAVMIFMLLVITWYVDNPIHKGVEIYFTTDKSVQRIIIRDNNRVLLYTPGERHDAEKIIEQVNVDYADYAAKSGSFAGVEPLKGNYYSDNLILDDCFLNTGDVMIQIVNSDSVCVPSDVYVDGKRRMLLVCGKFKGDIMAAVGATGVDEVLLGADLNSVRRRRYYRELHDAGVKVVDLSVQALKVTK